MRRAGGRRYGVLGRAYFFGVDRKALLEPEAIADEAS